MKKHDAAEFVRRRVSILSEIGLALAINKEIEVINQGIHDYPAIAQGPGNIFQMLYVFQQFNRKIVFNNFVAFVGNIEEYKCKNCKSNLKAWEPYCLSEQDEDKLREINERYRLVRNNHVSHIGPKPFKECIGSFNGDGYDDAKDDLSEATRILRQVGDDYAVEVLPCGKEHYSVEGVKQLYRVLVMTSSEEAYKAHL